MIVQRASAPNEMAPWSKFLGESIADAIASFLLLGFITQHLIARERHVDSLFRVKGSS